jgi:hypothetical protein
MLVRKLHQRQMAFVQIAHGRHKARPVLPPQLVAQLINGVDDFHSLS